MSQNFRPGLSSAATTSTLGLLADLAGTWIGTGFNIIALPDFDKRPPSTGPKPFRLELNTTQETLTFTPIGGNVPNRGSLTAFPSPQDPTPTGQNDINLHGLTYLQQVSDANTHSGIHIEPGIWIRVPASNIPKQEETYVRLATIPHGDSLVAQSSFAQNVPGGPKIDETESSLPIGIPHEAQQDYNQPYFFTAPPAGAQKSWIINPNLALTAAIQNQKIIKTTVLQISTDPAGGIVNIPFVVKNANAVKMTAIFWIETVEQANGSTFQQLQYTQNVTLDFLGIQWPHISVATLVKF